jgi:hypothetical protein
LNRDRIEEMAYGKYGKMQNGCGAERREREGTEQKGLETLGRDTHNV